MLSVLVLLGATFAFLVTRAHRRARSSGYHPEGKLRWSDDDDLSSSRRQPND